MLVSWWPVHQAPCLSTEHKVSGAALRGELATNRPERENHRGGMMELQHIAGTPVGVAWREKGWQSKTTLKYINMAPSSRSRSTDPGAGERPPTNPAPPSPKALFKIWPEKDSVEMSS